MVQLRRTAATADGVRPRVRAAHPEQALRALPVMRVDDLAGAIWLPGDGKANPTDLTSALAKGARKRGARIVERTRVHRHPCTATAAFSGVRTDAGDVEAEIVVNCAGPVGQAARRHGGRHRAAALGRALLRGHRADRRRATRPADPARPRRLHLLQGGGRRAGRRRLRAPGQALGLAGRAPVPVRVPAARRGLGPLLGADGQRAAPDPGAGRDRDPKFYNGPESFTPDNQFILGEAPEVRGFFVGAGFNSVGIASAGRRRPRAGGVDRRAASRPAT